MATAGPETKDEGEEEELEGDRPRRCWNPPPFSPSSSSGVAVVEGERVAIRAASRQTSALTKIGAPQRRARLMPSDGRQSMQPPPEIEEELEEELEEEELEEELEEEELEEVVPSPPATAAEAEEAPPGATHARA